jgi:large subunit ribosomal protein L28
MSIPEPVVRFTLTDFGSGAVTFSVSHRPQPETLVWGGHSFRLRSGQACPPHTRWPKRVNSAKIKPCGSVSTYLESFMAHVCEICGKGPQFGNNISHAHNVTKRRWNVNLRPVHAKVGAATKRMRVCTSCLRSGKVVKA